jgi:hypothetical protein
MPMRRSVRTAKMAVGDRVHVHETAEAIAAGVAGLVGDVVGFAGPSDTHVAVIGAAGEESAVNVSFTEKEGAFWFAREQLDVIGRALASGDKSSGADPEASKDASGGSDGVDPAAAKPKPWWKFGRG